MKRYWQRREDINKLHNSPKYRKLRRLLYIVTFIVVLIQLAMIIWYGGKNETSTLFVA